MGTSGSTPARAGSPSAQLKLLRTSSHLLLTEAAQYITEVSGAQCDLVRLLRWVLQGDLTLTLEFKRPARGYRATVVPPHQAGELTPGVPVFEDHWFCWPADTSPSLAHDRAWIAESQIEGRDTRIRALDGGTVLRLDDEPQAIEGFMNLVLHGDGKHHVQNLLEAALGRPRLKMDRATGMLVRTPRPLQHDAPEEIFELADTISTGEWHTSIGVGEDYADNVIAREDLDNFLRHVLQIDLPSETDGLVFETALLLIHILRQELLRDQGRGGAKALDFAIDSYQVVGLGRSNASRYFSRANEVFDRFKRSSR